MSAAIDTQPRDPLNAARQVAASPYGWCEAPSGSRATATLRSRQAWCVAATLPKAERRAHAALHRFGFNAYLPLVTTRWRNRTWHTGPLWPGYVFVQLDLSKPWSPVKYAPGVFNLVSTNGIPAQCPVGAVEAIQEAEAVRSLYPPAEQPWRPGQPCRLDYGPYDGVDAVVLKVGKADRVLVAMMMFGHLREVAVDANCLRVRDE